MSRAGVNEVSPFLQALKAIWIEVGNIDSALDFFWHEMEYERARHLLLDILKMPRLMDVELTSGPFHVGWGLSDDHLIRMVFCKSGGLGTGGGAIELQGHSEEKLHPNAGIARGSTPGGTVLVTFTCNEMDEVHSRITNDGGFECTEIHTLDSGPFSGKRSFIIWCVEGAPLQLIEAQAPHANVGSFE